MQETDKTTAQIERRMLKWMVLVSCAGAAAAAVFLPAIFAGGFAVGAAVSVLGYFWLMEAMSGALNSGQPRMTKGLVIKLILRYPILLGALYLFYRTKWLPAEAVLAGLFVPLAGGVVECLYQVGGLVIQARSPRL